MVFIATPFVWYFIDTLSTGQKYLMFLITAERVEGWRKIIMNGANIEVLSL
jgi:hypothetical protein